MTAGGGDVPPAGEFDDRGGQVPQGMPLSRVHGSGTRAGYYARPEALAASTASPGTQNPEVVPWQGRSEIMTRQVRPSAAIMGAGVQLDRTGGRALREQGCTFGKSCRNIWQDETTELFVVGLVRLRVCLAGHNLPPLGIELTGVPAGDPSVGTCAVPHTSYDDS